VKTADDVDGSAVDRRENTTRPSNTTMDPNSRDGSREFEYHLRQAFHLAERDEVKYHIRAAAAALDE
jgi:hypothetical protein